MKGATIQSVQNGWSCWLIFISFFGDKFLIGSGSKCGNDERRPFLRESSTTGDNRLHVVNCSSWLRFMDGALYKITVNVFYY